VGTLVYSMLVSLDGFVATIEGGLDWHVISEEWHRSVNRQTEGMAALLFGRRMWQLMDEFWPYAEDDPSQPDWIREYSRIWKSKPKYVCSTSLREVGRGVRLLRSVHDVAALKAGTDGTITLGGPDLAASLAHAGLIDEFELHLQPVAIGAGRPFWPAGFAAPLELRETSTFGSGVVRVRYAVAPRIQDRMA